MTASPPASVSISATSKPRNASCSAISVAGAVTSTKSRTQEIRSRIRSVRELLQEPEVVLVKQPDVADLMPEDRDPLDAEAPGEPGVFLCVVTDRLEHRRVHHAAAADLDPAGPLAHLAAGAVALPAADVDLGAWLGVREEAGPETDS